MSANDLSQLTLNPIIVYATLALYGLLFAFTFIYFHSKFRKAGRALQVLKKEWDVVETQHVGFIETAKSGIARLANQPKAAPPVVAAVNVTVDTRSQVIAMGKRGCTVADIARSCGLPEGEVDVLLSFARMQR